MNRNAAVIIPTDNCSYCDLIALSVDVIYGYNIDKTVNSVSGKNYKNNTIQTEEE